MPEFDELDLNDNALPRCQFAMFHKLDRSIHAFAWSTLCRWTMIASATQLTIYWPEAIVTLHGRNLGEFSDALATHTAERFVEVERKKIKELPAYLPVVERIDIKPR